MRRILCVCAGNASLGIGIAGIFLPLLPTTPFLLLSVFFYIQGSARIDRWMHAHPQWARSIKIVSYYCVARPGAVLMRMLVRGLWHVLPMLLRGLGWSLKPLAALIVMMIARGIDSAIRWASDQPQPAHNRSLPQLAGMPVS